MKEEKQMCLNLFGNNCTNHVYIQYYPFTFQESFSNSIDIFTEDSFYLHIVRNSSVISFNANKQSLMLHVGAVHSQYVSPTSVLKLRDNNCNHIVVYETMQQVRKIFIARKYMFTIEESLVLISINFNKSYFTNINLIFPNNTTIMAK